MKKDELLRKYPKESFEEAFKSKEEILKKMDSNVDISFKKEEYQDIFYYDSLVSELKEKVANFKLKEVEKYTSSRITFHFLEIGHLSSQLNLIYDDLGSPHLIFRKFDDELVELKYFSKIILNTRDGGIYSRIRVLDNYIGEVKNLIKEVSDDNLNKDISKINEAVELANKIIENSGKYEEATQIAENWIGAVGRADSVSLGKKSEAFHSKAEDYKSKKPSMVGHIGWFLGGVFMGLTALSVVGFFIYDLRNNNDISIGFALMRISVLFVISYFAYFMLFQFTNNKRLYESYKFKAIALETMEELVKSYDKEGDRERVLNKAIDIIFDDPTKSAKEDGNLQKKLLDELIDILKKKI